MPRFSVLIRVDASNARGFGHLMRCIALAQEFKGRGIEPCFAVAETQGIELLCESFPWFDLIEIKARSLVEDLAQTRGVIKQGDYSVVVLDSYDFSAAYLSRLGEGDALVVVLDDLNHLEFYPVDFIVNQNVYAESLRYHCPDSCRLLLGMKYVLLRREFLGVGGCVRENAVPRVLVSFGGSDVRNALIKVACAFRSMGERFEPVFLLGRALAMEERVKAILRGWHNNFEVVHWVERLPELMASCDFAVSAAGTTLYELAFCGTPAITLVEAGNQFGIADGMMKAGFSFNLGDVGEVEEETIAEFVARMVSDRGLVRRMGERGRRLVDGLGGNRVVSSVMSALS